MNCALCDKPIEKYDSAFNHLVIDDTHKLDICQECISKFVKWHGRTLSVLFPTKALKKKYEKKRLV